MGNGMEIKVDVHWALLGDLGYWFYILHHSVVLTMYLDALEQFRS